MPDTIMFAPSLAPARSHQTYVSSASTALEAALRSVGQSAPLERVYTPWLTTPILAFLQDILENEDVKLDNMFIASMVADIIRVSAVCCNLILMAYPNPAYWLLLSSNIYAVTSAGRHLLARIAHSLSWLAVHIQLPGGLTLGGQIDGFWIVCLQAGHRGEFQRYAAYDSQVSE